MHLGDSIFIFILALILFGPKKLPEMAKQIGKLMAEFRRASADFRLQIDEELRTMERQEQQKKQEAERAALLPASNADTSEASVLMPLVPAVADAAKPLQILPPDVGEQVSAGTPYAVSAEPMSATPGREPASQDGAEDHPLLRVESIPIDANDPHANGTQPTGIAAAEANAARLLDGGVFDPASHRDPVTHSTTSPAPTTPSETEQASLHNG